MYRNIAMAFAKSSIFKKQNEEFMLTCLITHVYTCINCVELHLDVGI